MRRLHPIGPHETPLREGRVLRPNGADEQFTVHALPEDRRVVRVEVAGAALWHLMLDASGAPERAELRLTEAGRTLEATYTFFEDEVLIWRRGGEPASDAIAMPPGYRLLWPPVAGRDLCLADIAPPDGSRQAQMCLWMQLTGAERGWLRARPVKFTVRADAGGFDLDTPGLAPMRGELDPEGTLVRWRQGDQAWDVRTDA